VLDPYIGSGTTAAVSLRMKRRVVGIDLNTEALQITRSRLEAALGISPREESVVQSPGVRRAARKRAPRSAA
jgi:DNA modification methylase